MTPEQGLRWRCRRGMRELDLLLLGFLDRGYDGLDAQGRAAFVRMLDYPDQEMLEILLGNVEASDREVAAVVERIREAAVP